MMEGKMVDVDLSKIVHIVITVAFTLWVILVIAYCYVIEVFRKRHPRCRDVRVIERRGSNTWNIIIARIAI